MDYFSLNRVKWAVAASVIVGAVLIALGTAVLAQDDDWPPLVGDIMFTIQFGDTLDQIGAYYDVSVDCIYSVNNMRAGDWLHPGDEIIISSACPHYDGAAFVANSRQLDTMDENGNLIIMIRSGDTLSTIAQRFGVSLDAILIANELQRDSLIRAGDRLIIPNGAPPFGIVPAISTPEGLAPIESGGGSALPFYIVQYGDNLDLIAAYFNVDLACFASANLITTASMITPGLALVIPPNCPPYDGASAVLPAKLGGLNVTPVFFATLDGIMTLTPTSAPSATPQIFPTAVDLTLTPTPEVFPTQEPTSVPTQVATQIIFPTAVDLTSEPELALSLTPQPTNTPDPVTGQLAEFAATATALAGG